MKSSFNSCSQHESFEELAALAAVGELSPLELQRLITIWRNVPHAGRHVRHIRTQPGMILAQPLQLPTLLTMSVQAMPMKRKREHIWHGFGTGSRLMPRASNRLQVFAQRR
jgi:hypothetical protein